MFGSIQNKKSDIRKMYSIAKQKHENRNLKNAISKSSCYYMELLLSGMNAVLEANTKQ